MKLLYENLALFTKKCILYLYLSHFTKNNYVMLSGIPYLRTFFNFSDSTFPEVVSVSDCLSLLRKRLRNPSKKNKQKSWLERVQVREENWRRSRSQIWDALYANIVVKGFFDVCNEREAVIKCNDCFDGSFCYLCDDITHTS